MTSVREAIRRHLESRKIPESRPAEVHDLPCRRCPSACGSDPEADQMLASGDAAWLRESEFACAWRPDKLCRGNHDKVAAALAEIGGP